MIFKKHPKFVEKTIYAISSIYHHNHMEIAILYGVKGVSVNGFLSAESQPKGVFMKSNNHLTFHRLDQSIQIKELSKHTIEWFDCEIEEVL